LSSSYTNFEIKIEFDLDSDNIVSTKRNQIVLFGSTQTSVNYA